METSLKREVRIALAIKGKTQSWLAQKLGINESQLSRILNGRDEPKRQIEKIRNFLKEG